MDVQKLLRWADQQVFAQTDKHLDDLQEAILRGAWERQKYSDIAKSYHCTEVHVKKVASQLWKVLSETLGDGEQVNKSNLRATFDRWQVSNVSHFRQDIGHIGDVNLCGSTSNLPDVEKRQGADGIARPNKTKSPRRVDLADAPDIDYCCDRSLDIATLENSILEKRTRLVAILGISGMGKTAIALRLISQIEDKFDRVVWRSLRAAPPPEATVKSLIRFLGDRQPSNTAENGDSEINEDRLSLLIEYLRNYRCLIVLDDVEMVLQSQRFVGHYRPGYENYRDLFKILGELSHQSCLILNSWELPLEIVDLKNKNAPVCCWQLQGLGKAANRILEEMGLLDPEKWSELIDIYGGNPHWLKIAATGIKDLFGGKVAEYLQYRPLFLGDELKTILERHLSRLSELERQIVFQLSAKGEPVSISSLLEGSGSSTDILNAVQSLAKRSLIEKIESQKQIRFALKRIFQEYLSVRDSKFQHLNN